MISSRHEAWVFCSHIDARPCDGSDRSHQLLNTANANFRPSRSLPNSLASRPGARKPGPNPHRHVTNSRVAGLGLARSKDRGQHGRWSHGDLGLRLLCNVLSAVRTVGLLGFLRGSLLRSILLFIHSTEHSLSQQGRDFRQRQGCVFSVRRIAVDADRKFCRIVRRNGRAFLRV